MDKREPQVTDILIQLILKIMKDDLDKFKSKEIQYRSTGEEILDQVVRNLDINPQLYNISQITIKMKIDNDPAIGGVAKRWAELPTQKKTGPKTSLTFENPYSAESDKQHILEIIKSDLANKIGTNQPRMTSKDIATQLNNVSGRTINKIQPVLFQAVDKLIGQMKDDPTIIAWRELPTKPGWESKRDKYNG